MSETDLRGEEFQANPYPSYARLRQAAPVQKVSGPMGLDSWLITRYDLAQAALLDPRLSKDPSQARLWLRNMGAGSGDEGLLGANMLNSDPPDHTRQRRLVSQAFTQRRIESLRPRVQQICDQLLDGLAGSGRPDLVAGLAFPLPITVICELLGIPVADRENFGAWTHMALSPPQSEEAVLRRKQGNAEMERYLTRLIGSMRATVDFTLAGDRQPNLLSALIAACDGHDRLSERELIGMAKLLIVAGHNNTANLIGNGMLALLRNPDQLAQLREHPEFLPSAIEELLRFDGPVERATPRFATEDIELAGVTIPKGSAVAVVLGAADRDPSLFPDPDRLDIQRTGSEHLAFGHGIHFCLGAALARMEGQVAIGSLLARFPVIRLACPQDELRWRIGGPSITRGLEALPVALRS
ncbi:Cytochrome P450 107B1 [Streptomyces sp. YIM 130001]|uniref:cytochrome P450 family protein n=1 Tax=Streptomyces sp. YIM 130001 TaxID=2259644 RepID=UPI000E6587F0|nr:cytochrome P450 [Streptomyces sp. YIM 130001]RII07934.1 Cytochrome P450 107B1 [Streptomyces sp. YIM 130001]